MGYQTKYDQRDLMRVIQRNYRKYMMLRDWGWFQLLQKTKPLIGMRDVEGELGALEAQANEAYGAYKIQLDTMARLKEENVAIKEEKKALMKQLESEQGNMGEYTERQSIISEQKAGLEIELEEAGKRLIIAEQERQDASAEKKTLESDMGVFKKDIEDLDIAIQKLEQE